MIRNVTGISTYSTPDLVDEEQEDRQRDEAYSFPLGGLKLGVMLRSTEAQPGTACGQRCQQYKTGHVSIHVTLV